MNIPALKNLARKGIVYLILPGGGVNVIKIEGNKYTSYRTNSDTCSCLDFFENNSCKHLKLRRLAFKGSGADCVTIRSIWENIGLTLPDFQLPSDGVFKSLNIGIDLDQPFIAYCDPRITMYLGEKPLERLKCL